jgi:hypothetical protein
MMKKLPFLLFVLAITFPVMTFGQTIIDCGAGTVSQTYCYGNSDNTQLVFQNNDGFPLTLTFISGETEQNWDEVLVLDTDGTNLNEDNPYGNSGDLSGFTWTSTGDTITLQIQSDNIVSCSSGSQDEWNFEISCQTCIAPTIDFNVVNGNCDNFEYSVEVNVSDFGSISSLNISDNLGGIGEILNDVGTVVLGPFAASDEVIITAASEDPNCVEISEPLSFLCPPPPNECSIVYAGEDLEVVCPSPEVTLTANVHANGIDLQNYDINELDGCILPPTSGGGTPTNLLIDDRWSEVIDLGFDFCFFGETYSQILIGANGLVTFDLDEAGAFCPWNIDAGDAIPSPDIPVNSIMGAWHDINPAVSGDPSQIQYTILGSAPSRQFVINYTDVVHFSGSCSNFETTQQIILYESSNVIDINLVDKPVCTAWNDGFAIAGIQNADGTIGFAPANRNGGAWEAQNELYRFSYAGDSAYIFEWQDEDGNVVGTDLELTVTPTQTTTYTASTTYFNCDGTPNVVTDEVTVTLIADFDLDVTSDATDGCFVGSTDLTATVSNNTTMSTPTYEWSTAETTPTITVTEPGTYTVTVTVDSCSLTESITVATTPLFDLGADISSCLETPAILDATPSNYPLSDVSFQWFLDGNELTTETDATLSATQLGTYTATVTALGACSETDMLTITPGALPMIDVGEDFASCLVDPVVLDATPSNYDPADATFEWSLDGNVLTAETNPTLSASQNGTYSVLVTVGACESTDDITISDGEAPIVDLGEDFASCLVDPFVIDATPSNYDPADVTFTWSLDGTLLSDETDATLSATANGTYSVTVSLGTCSTTDTITINEGESPIFDLGENYSTCFITPETLDATPSNHDVADATFEWTLDGTVLTGETNATLDVTSVGVYAVTVTVGNCVDTDSITITNGDAPDVDLGDDFNSCFVDTAVLDATPSNYNVADATFEWSLDGTVLGAETDATLTISQTGVYSVIVTVGTCTGTDSITIQQGDAPAVDLGADFTSCFLTPEILDATPSNYDVADSTFEWSFNGTVLTGETDPTLSTTDLGTYSVTVTSGECTTTDSVTITEGEAPVIELGDNFETCFETPEVLDATPSNYNVSDVTFEWSLNGTVIFGETNATLEAIEDGNYTVVVTAGACSSTDAVTINLRDDITVQINDGEDTVFGCGGENITLTAVASESGVSYQWFEEDGTELAGETNDTLVIQIPSDPLSPRGVYVVVSKGSCTGSNAIDVQRYEIDNCRISQGISPDTTPGFNDCLDLEFLSERTGIASLELFNRHGRSVFKKNNYVADWCGQSDNGDKLPTGTYYYVIKLNGVDPVFGDMQTGWIYLNRNAN